MERFYSVNGVTYSALRLLGHGKGGYSYLVERHGAEYVLKQIHHEPCSYYTFGNKIEAEYHDYHRLLDAGICMPRMLDIDWKAERIVKAYIPGPTVYDLVRENQVKQTHFDQVRYMAGQAMAAGLNIDYFPTNFVVREDRLYYVDYECNPYMPQWDFENWGIRYWSKTREFLEYEAAHK